MPVVHALRPTLINGISWTSIVSMLQKEFMFVIEDEQHIDHNWPRCREEDIAKWLTKNVT